MIKSMTGFGKREATWQQTTITVEVRSVNHRYREIFLRMPKGLLRLEEEVKQLVSQRCQRGRIEMNVTISGERELSNTLSWNRPIAKQYFQILKEMKREFHIESPITLELLLTCRDILSVREEATPDRSVEKPIKRLVTGALGDLDAMRCREGKVLSTDISHRLTHLVTMLRRLQTYMPKLVEEGVQRMKARLNQLVSPGRIDEGRVAQELALMADRCDVSEEITRLESHTAQFKGLLKSKNSVGRQLDFLLQEMNREINTIGSKANNAGISSLVVQMKSELEKIREQVQNVE